MFEKLIGEEVKVVFNDGDKEKVARGTLVRYDDPHIYISGVKGDIILNKEKVVKASIAEGG